MHMLEEENRTYIDAVKMPGPLKLLFWEQYYSLLCCQIGACVGLDVNVHSDCSRIAL